MLASLVKISPKEAWKSPGRGECCNAVMQAFEKYRGSKTTKTVEMIPYCRAILDAMQGEERGWGPLISSLWANVSLTASVVAYKEVCPSQAVEGQTQLSKSAEESQSSRDTGMHSQGIFVMQKSGLAGKTWDLKAWDLDILMDAHKNVNSTRPSTFPRKS